MVTGGASGIRRARAALFLEEGCGICVFDRSAQASERITAVIKADALNLEPVRAAVGEAIEHMGSIDVVINNAGISIRNDLVMDVAETTGGVCSQWAHE